MNWFFNCLFQMSDFSFSWNIFFFDEKNEIGIQEQSIPVSVDFLCLCNHRTFFHENSWKTEQQQQNYWKTTIATEDEIKKKLSTSIF